MRVLPEMKSAQAGPRRICYSNPSPIHPAGIDFCKLGGRMGARRSSSLSESDSASRRTGAGVALCFFAGGIGQRSLVLGSTLARPRNFDRYNGK